VEQDNRFPATHLDVVSGTAVQVDELPRGVFTAPLVKGLTIPWNELGHDQTTVPFVNIWSDLVVKCVAIRVTLIDG
jgi:hypothetical protein